MSFRSVRGLQGTDCQDACAIDPETGPDLKCMECCDVCPPVLKKAPVTGLQRPLAPVKHLTNTKYQRQFRDYELLPFAPYPPGGLPTGGDPDLRISSEEWARRAMDSECYKCHVRFDANRAARLRPNWMFWVGLGAGALGAMTLVLKRRK